MYKARTKTDLMIEVWEALDCESVGAEEIIAIENAARERFGNSAVDSPMRIARLLADEGAELRHSEIMELAVERLFESPDDSVFTNILKFADFKETLISIRELEKMRIKFVLEKDHEGLRRVRETALTGKDRASMISKNEKAEERQRAEKAEVAMWFTIWLQSPEIFENWITLRMNSKGFRARFGD